MPGIDSYTKLLVQANSYDGDTIFVDSSLNSRAITTVGNAQIDTAQKKFRDSSALFDGTGDYLSLSDSTDWFFDTADFTIDFQVRFASVSSAQAFYSQGSDANNKTEFYWNNSGTVLTFYSRVTAGVRASYTWVWAPTTIPWYHVELTRNGTNLYCFVDGVPLTPTVTTAIASNSIPNLASDIRIGYRMVHNDMSMNGWLDEYRISTGIARHTADFSASLPTVEYSYDSGLAAPTTCRVLVVGGGGGYALLNGRYPSSGAGPVHVYNASLSITPGIPISLSVGAGGAGGSYTVNGYPGGNSIFDTLISYGGGGAAAGGVVGGRNVTYVGGTGINLSGGGGAGATANGSTYSGGAGVNSTISGTTIGYAGGGASMTNGNSPGSASHGGGVPGVRAPRPYSGGGGCDGYTGAGGVVVISYLTPANDSGEGGTISHSGGYTIHSFFITGSATFTPPGAGYGATSFDLSLDLISPTINSYKYDVDSFFLSLVKTYTTIMNPLQEIKRRTGLTISKSKAFIATPKSVDNLAAISYTSTKQQPQLRPTTLNSPIIFHTRTE